MWASELRTPAPVIDHSLLPERQTSSRYDGLMGAMEAADPDVDDTATEHASVIRGDGDPWVKPAEALGREFEAAPAAVVSGHAHTLLQHKHR